MSRNHAFHIDPPNTEDPSIRFNTSALQGGLTAVGFVRRIFGVPPRRLGSFGAIHMAPNPDWVCSVEKRDALRTLRLDQNREKRSRIFYILTFLSIY